LFRPKMDKSNLTIFALTAASCQTLPAAEVPPRANRCVTSRNVTSNCPKLSFSLLGTGVLSPIPVIPITVPNACIRNTAYVTAARWVSDPFHIESKTRCHWSGEAADGVVPPVDRRLRIIDLLRRSPIPVNFFALPTYLLPYLPYSRAEKRILRQRRERFRLIRP